MNKKCEQDSELFQAAMEGVTPLNTTVKVTPQKANKAVITNSRSKIKNAKTTPAASNYQQDIATSSLRLDLDERDFIEGVESLFYVRNSLPTKTLRQLKRGQLPIEAELDLHGYTLAEAAEVFAHFMDDCFAQHKRVIGIIHGKGTPGKGAKLKSYVNVWLQDTPEVLAFCSAKPCSGGTGALSVILKRQPKDLLK